MGELPGPSVSWTPQPGTLSAQTGARTLLQIQLDAVLTPEDVAAAYRAALKRHHPDTGDGKVRPADIKKARDVLLAALNQPATPGTESHESTCKTCGGSGRVGLGFGMQCAACGGTGEA